MTTINVPVEFASAYDQTPFGEFDAQVSASTDRAVTSCDLLNLSIPGRGDLTIVLDAEFRKTPVGQAFQHVWDVVNEQQEAGK